MKYAGMPMGMWVLFAGSFQKQLTAVLGYDADTAKDKQKKWLFGTVGMAVVAAVLAAIMTVQ